ncbi:FG-GAP and VCBS repeat-containing protein [Streptomyces bungoensis]
MFSLRSHARWALPVALGVTALGLAVPAASAKAAVPVHDDFNGDGYADLAVAAPKATVSGQSGAGYAAVLYGGPHGVSADRHTTLSRSTTGVPGAAVKNQGFGGRLSRGDLDGDGYADLVVATSSGTGDAVVFWGGKSGLSGARSTKVAASDTQTGDFNGDGKLDLAVFRTTPAGGDDPIGSTGAVWSGPFTRSGTPAAKKSLDAGYLKYVDVHGGATGDVNGDGRTDLALRVYCGDGSYCTRFYTGTATGLTAQGAIPGGGGAVALGDLNGDGYDDVAVGEPDDASVQVAYGSASGPGPQSTWKSYSQATPGVPGTADEVDNFGAALSAGDITGDGIDDLVIGAPSKELGYDDAAGAVVVLQGSGTGLTATHAQQITQGTPGVPGASELADTFGAATALLDTDRDGHADLAVGAPGENGRNGAVTVLRGAASGITADGALSVSGKKIGAPYTKSAFGAVLR